MTDPSLLATNKWTVHYLGFVSPLPCAAGQFKLGPASPCVPCPFGKFDPVQATAPLDGWSRCQDCPAGKYQSHRGQTRCLDKRRTRYTLERLQPPTPAPPVAYGRRVTFTLFAAGESVQDFGWLQQRRFSEAVAAALGVPHDAVALRAVGGMAPMMRRRLREGGEGEEGGESGESGEADESYEGYEGGEGGTAGEGFEATMADSGDSGADAADAADAAEAATAAAVTGGTGAAAGMSIDVAVLLSPSQFRRLYKVWAGDPGAVLRRHAFLRRLAQQLSAKGFASLSAGRLSIGSNVKLAVWGTSPQQEAAQEKAALSASKAAGEDPAATAAAVAAAARRGAGTGVRADVEVMEIMCVATFALLVMVVMWSKQLKEYRKMQAFESQRLRLEASAGSHATVPMGGMGVTGKGGAKNDAFGSGAAAAFISARAAPTPAPAAPGAFECARLPASSAWQDEYDAVERSAMGTVGGGMPGTPGGGGSYGSTAAGDSSGSGRHSPQPGEVVGDDVPLIA